MRLDADTVAFTIEDQRRKALGIKALQRSSGMLSTVSKSGRGKSTAEQLRSWLFTY